MTTFRKLVRAQINALGDDEVEVVMSTDALARDGHILIPQGCRIDNYRANPIVLWSHDPDKPIGNAEDVAVGPDKITARVRFAAMGIDPEADRIRGLVKTGVIRAVSIGFEAIEGEPIDPKKPRGGQRVSDWELFELSFVSVPSDVGAMVTARAKGDESMAEWKVGAARNLAIEDSDDWDGDAAAQSIFAFAGGDEFDATKARKGFLVYDASATDKRGSYKLPIAHAVDGELKVPKGAIRAVASRLPDTDLPDAVREKAQGVLDHYKKEAGIGDDEGGRAAPRPKTRRVKVRGRANGVRVTRDAKITFKRGLYEVASLCYLFEQLGWHVDMAEWEAAIEEDESKVPAMLGAVLADLGEALLAMTAEEVAEALAGRDIEIDYGEDDDEDLVLEERTAIAAAKTPAVRAFRRGLAHAKLRAGKTLSAETVRCIRDAIAQHEDAMDDCRSGLKKHRAAIGDLNDLMDRAGVSDPDDDATQTVQTSDGVDVSEGSDNGRSADFRRRQAEALALEAVH